MSRLVIAGPTGWCVLCGGEIGPDYVGEPMCYGCGDPEIIPHKGEHCERCGGKLVSGQFFDLACPDCDMGGYRDGSE